MYNSYIVHPSVATSYLNCATYSYLKLPWLLAWVSTPIPMAIFLAENSMHCYLSHWCSGLHASSFLGDSLRINFRTLPFFEDDTSNCFYLGVPIYVCVTVYIATYTFTSVCTLPISHAYFAVKFDYIISKLCLWTEFRKKHYLHQTMVLLLIIQGNMNFFTKLQSFFSAFRNELATLLSCSTNGSQAAQYFTTSNPKHSDPFSAKEKFIHAKVLASCSFAIASLHFSHY